MQHSTKSNLVDRPKQLTGFCFATWLPKQWHRFSVWHFILLPVSWFFLTIVFIRAWLYRQGFLKSIALTVPVVIVGNINVGGTGKTPLVIYIVEQLKKSGFNPGVISRGFGVNALAVLAVQHNSLASEVGDEPLLIKRRLNCPVYIHQDRVLAGQALLTDHPKCDIVLSDDGLQHYRLKRDVEICVLDATVGFGNGALLPAGPLREPVSRLMTVDTIVINGSLHGRHEFSDRYFSKIHEMQINAEKFYNLENPSKVCEANDFIGSSNVAIAGIGNPERFFQQLKSLKLDFKKYSFPDHHAFSADDFVNIKADFILMTEKDAVKCKPFVQSNFWVLPISASIDDDFMTNLLQQLRLKTRT